jgi:galactonate dehydratase
MDIVQPEMGHTGVTEFMKIARMAEAFHCRVIPHASIGIGIFQAASLHAAAALPHVPVSRYQHSVFDRNLRFVTGDMRCERGRSICRAEPATASRRATTSGNTSSSNSEGGRAP